MSTARFDYKQLNERLKDTVDYTLNSTSGFFLAKVRTQQTAQTTERAPREDRGITKPMSRPGN